MVHKPCDKVLELEQKWTRIEKLLWYCAGFVSLELGNKALPLVTALMK